MSTEQNEFRIAGIPVTLTPNSSGFTIEVVNYHPLVKGPEHMLLKVLLPMSLQLGTSYHSDKGKIICDPSQYNGPEDCAPNIETTRKLLTELSQDFSNGLPKRLQRPEEEALRGAAEILRLTLEYLKERGHSLSEQEETGLAEKIVHARLASLPLQQPIVQKK